MEKMVSSQSEGKIVSTLVVLSRVNDVHFHV